MPFLCLSNSFIIPLFQTLVKLLNIKNRLGEVDESVKLKATELNKCQIKICPKHQCVNFLPPYKLEK